jgi:hypothetical protein
MSDGSFRCVHGHSASSHPQCYARFVSGKITTKKAKNFRSARILLLDVETLPGEYYAFDPKVEYLSPDKQIKGVSISCYAAKWLFEPEIMGEVVKAREAYERSDWSILGGIWKLMNEADIIITHNGLNFDIPLLYGRFVTNKMMPPTKFQNIDTCKTSKNVFKFEYNRLDELGQRFGIGKKLDMSFTDWRNCLTKNKKAEKALQNMLTYCKNDIAPLLEDVYLSMLPYIPNHPNLGLWNVEMDKDCCKNCESTNLLWNTKPYATPSGLWMSWRCQSCGAVGRSTNRKDKIKSVSLT